MRGKYSYLSGRIIKWARRNESCDDIEAGCFALVGRGDAISLRAEGEYYARFEWLLRLLGLDFIDDDFKESANGLSWEGLVKGVPTTVTVEVPVIDSSVYRAWEHPIGHCHAHAWWYD